MHYEDFENRKYTHYLQIEKYPKTPMKESEVSYRNTLKIQVKCLKSGVEIFMLHVYSQVKMLGTFGNQNGGNNEYIIKAVAL